MTVNKSNTENNALPVNPTTFVLDGVVTSARSVQSRGANPNFYLTTIKTPNPDEFSTGSRFAIKSNEPIAQAPNERIKIRVRFSNFVRDEQGIKDGKSWHVTNNQTAFEFIERV